MAYIDENLMDNEKIIFRCKPHPIIFSNAMIWTVFMLAAFMIGPYTDMGKYFLFKHRLYSVAGTLAFACAVFSFMMSYIDYTCSEFGITNKRVLVKLGFIRRTSFEVLLSKIESIQVVQSILGRMFSYGTIIIAGTGGSRDAFRNIPRPLRFRKLVQEQVELYEDTHN